MLHRRDLLLAGTAGIAAAVWPGLLRADAAPKEGMTLGYSTYALKSMEAQQALRIVREAGFDSIEICVTPGWDTDSATLGKPRREALRKQLADSGLRLTSLMEHIHPENDELQRTALERLKLAAELAHELAPNDPPLVQSTLGGGKWEQVRTPLRDRLGEWLQVAESSQTLVAIKPHRGGAMSQPVEAVWLLEQLGRPKWLKMVYDYSHYAFRDLPLSSTIQTALPFTAHIAVKDAAEINGRVVFRLAGEAETIDYPQLLRQFAAGGFHGDVNCEVSGMIWNQPNYDPLRAVRHCHTYMAKAFEQAGVKRRS